MREGRPLLQAWQRLPLALGAAVLWVLYVGTAAGACALATPEGGVVAFWPSAGIAVVALVLARRGAWPVLLPVIAAASATSELWRGEGAQVAAALVAADVAIPAVAAMAISRVLRAPHPDLSQLHHLGAVTLASVAGPVAGAAVGAAVLLVAQGDPGLDLWLHYGVGASAGVLVITALACGAAVEDWRPPVAERRVETLVTVLAAGLATAAAFLLTDAPIMGLAIIPWLWASVRLGVIGAGLCTLVTGIVLLGATAAGEGQYAASSTSPATDLLIAESTVILMVIVGTALAALTIERQRSLERLRSREEEVSRMHRLESLGAIAGSVAHDFNNVLAMIGGHAERAQRAVDDGHDPHPDLDRVRQGVASGRALARQLLTFGRSAPTPAHRVPLNTVVADLHGFLARVMGRDIELDLHLDPRAGMVLADPTHLEQVVLNLVINARDASPPSSTVSLRTAAWNGEAAVVVADQGCGMDDATRQRALERGFTTKATGSGLGLATVHDIARQHGGRVEIDSAPGEGTTVHVVLPHTAVPDPAAEAMALRPAPGRGGRETVLLAEDSEHVRALMRLALAESGYTLLEAEDGLHALEVADAHPGPIDLLVTDLLMPRMGGLELYGLLRERRPELGVLFVGGDVGVAPEVDPALLLEKPFDLLDLTRRVRQALDRRVAA